MLTAKQRAEADREDQLYYQWKKGYEAGVVIAELLGDLRGEIRGEKHEKLKTASKMIDEDFKPETIKRITGLSFEEIEKLSG